MRICVDMRRHFACGIGRISLNLARALLHGSTGSYDVFLLTSPRNREKVLEIAEDRAEVIVADFNFFSESDLYALPNLVASLGLDAYIAPQFYITPFLPCPSIKMVHDLWPIIYPGWVPTRQELVSHFGHDAYRGMRTFVEWFDHNRELLPSWRNDELRALYDKRAGNLADAYMIAMYSTSIDTASVVPTCSYYSMDQVLSYFPHARAKMTVVYPFVEARSVDLDERTLNRRFKVLHVGKFEPRKNHMVLCEAFSMAFDRLPQEQRAHAELVLVGDISYRTYGREVLNQVRSMGSRYPIRFMGVVSDQQLSRLFDTASLFAFPSAFEGFGIPIIEAMSFGLPTLVSNWGGMAEAAGGGAHALESLDARIWADALLEVFLDRQQYRDLAARGLSRAREFTFDQTQAQVVKALEMADGSIAPNEWMHFGKSRSGTGRRIRSSR